MYQFEPINDEYIFQEFCKDLLNSVYSTKSFQTYKTKGSEQHGIDIFSIQHEIVAQCKKKKRLRSDKSLEIELLSDFRNSIELTKGHVSKFKTFILLTTTKRYGNVQDYAIKLSELNSFEVLFWSWEDIEPYIADFELLRNKYYPHLWSSENLYPKILTYIPKIDEKEIIGRKNELSVLKKKFDETNKIVLVSGIGGVGKSTFAKAFIVQNFNTYDHIVWIDVQKDNLNPKTIAEAFSNNITLLKNINLEFESELSIEDKLSIILNRIQNIEGKNILIIDNVSNKIVRYNDFLPASSNWNILLTSREKILCYSTMDLKVLDNYYAKELFYKYYKIEENERIVDILNYIDNHTLTIELLAKTANKRNLSTQSLIIALEKEGLNISKVAKVTINHNKQAEPVNPFEYLISIFSISNLENSQQELLMYFSVLPSKFISYEDLKLIFCIPDNDNDFFEDINELVSKGWLAIESFSYQMHQVVQEVLRKKFNPNIESCKKIINSITNIITIDYNESYLKILPYLSVADSVISRIYKKQEEFTTLLNNTAVIHLNNGNHDLAIKYYKELINVIDEEKAYEININLGVCYISIGEFSLALKYNLKSISILESTNESDFTNLALCYNNIAENYRKLGEINEALKYNLKALKYFEKSERNRPSSDAELATIYNNLSSTYSTLENRELSLKYGLKTIELREKALESNHPLLAQAYNNVGVDYEKIGLLDKSNYYHLKALNIREAIFKTDHYDLAETYNNFAQLLMLLNRTEDSINYHEKSIRIRLNVLPKYHPEIALAYNNLGGLYMEIGDFTKSKEYLELAIQIGENQDNRTNPDLGLYYLNYSMIKLVSHNLIEAKEYIEKSINIYEKIFKKNHPNYKLALEVQNTIKTATTQKNLLTTKKIGRNELCYCGSSKKYKKCCGK